jgi:hypothetical protein
LIAYEILPLLVILRQDPVANLMVELGDEETACACGKGSQGVQISTMTMYWDSILLTSGCAGKHND